MSLAAAEKLSDLDLIARTRRGDTDAYGELWRRHWRAGRAVAASITSRFEPDDVVAESFARIFRIVQAGGGPKTGFRSYLFTTIRNTAAEWGRNAREIPIDDADEIEDHRFSEEATLAADDRSLTVTAYRTLPPRYQEVLWYSEVEQMSPHEVAAILGIKPGTASVLAHRARESLRQAWIQAHVGKVPSGSEHHWTINHLGAYTRQALTAKSAQRVDAHLKECADCRLVAGEARHVGSRLALTILPLTIGAAAAGYRLWLQQPEHDVAAVSPMPDSVTGSDIVLASSVHRRIAIATAVVGGAALLIGGGIVVQSGLHRTDPIAATQSPTVTAPSPSASSTPTPTSITPAPTATPTAPARSSPHPTASRAPSAAPAAVVRIGAVDAGAGNLFAPRVSGTAHPGDTVTVTNGNAAPVAVSAGADGRWSTGPLTGFTAGTHEVTASAGGVSASAPVTLAPPPAIGYTSTRNGFSLTVSGIPGASVEVLADGVGGSWGRITLGPDGTGSAWYRWTPAPGVHTIAVRYTDGTRHGPAVTASLALPGTNADPPGTGPESPGPG